MEVEENPNYLYTTLTVKKIITSSRPSIFPHLLIKFNFFFKFKTFIQTLDSSTLIGQDPPSIIYASATVTVRERSVSYDAIREAVGVAVATLPDEHRHDLIEMACHEVDRSLRTETLPKHTNLRFEFHTRVDRVRYGVEFDGDQMVPAVESAVEVLEKVVEDFGERSSSCCICLEEFGDGDGDGVERRVLRMPCLHVFHGGCIEKWLRTSHYCPVCRYEMPTE